MADMHRRHLDESNHEKRHLSAAVTSQNQPLKDWTRDQLYRRAVELDIDGRSKMTKAQLIYALKGH